jgi:tetratricopeptide repeat protein 30
LEKIGFNFFIFKVNASREALTDMPPRSEAELDPITLHNIAMMNMNMV